MKIKNLIKDSLFAKSFKLAKSNPDKIGLMILFDALFIVFFFVLKKLFESFAGQFPLPTTASSFYIFMLFTLIYYLIVLLAYSFFKYSIIGFIRSLFAKTRFSIEQLWNFCLLNIIITGIFFAVMLGIDALLASLKPAYAPYVFIIFAIPYSLFLYVVINIAHSIFYKGASVKDTIKRSFSITFTRMKVYRETLFLMILSAFVLWLLFLGGGYLVRYSTSGNYAFYLNAYSHFRQISIIAADIMLYLIILINRISFYTAVNYNKIINQ